MCIFIDDDCDVMANFSRCFRGEGDVLVGTLTIIISGYKIEEKYNLYKINRNFDLRNRCYYVLIDGVKLQIYRTKMNVDFFQEA